MTILDPVTGGRVVVSMDDYRKKLRPSKDERPSDEWLATHQAETQAFIEDRRSFALRASEMSLAEPQSDPGDETD